MSPLTPYRRSGSLSLHSLYIVPAGIVIAAILGAVYEFAVIWMPLIYAKALFVIGLCWGNFYVIDHALKRGHCRNAMFGALVGLVMGVVALAGSYEVARWDMQRQLRNVINAPIVLPMKNFIDIRVESGWTINHMGSNAPLSGWVVYLCWIIEGVSIVGFATLAGLLASDDPYCEACGVWASKHERLRSGRTVGETTIRAVSAAPDLESLTVAYHDDDGPLASRIDFQLAACPVCLTQGFLTVQHVMMVQTKEGKLQERITPLRTNLMVDSESARRLFAPPVAKAEEASA